MLNKRGILLLVIVCCFNFWGCKSVGVSVNCNFENSSMEPVEQKEYQTKITKFINELYKYNDAINEVTIYISDIVPTKYQEDAMYINTEEVNEIDTFFRMLYGLNGRETNAGEAYGFAVQLYEKCKIGTVEDKHTTQELKEFFSDAEQLYLLDFTLPMMETYYFEEETVEYVQAAAVAFVEYCIDEYDAAEAYQMCMDTSEEGRVKLVELKNEWLAHIGVTEEYSECGKLLFEYNDVRETADYPYVIKEESANWYFSPADIKNEGYCTFVEEYLKVAPVAEIDFAEAREVLKDYILKDVPPVDIFTFFYKVDEVTMGAVYSHVEERVCIYTDWRSGLKYSLLHEYIHYLTVGENKLFEKAIGLVEGVTDEIATFECENHLKKMYYQELMSDEEYGEENHIFAKEIGALIPDTNELDVEVYYYYLAKFYYELEPHTGEYKAIMWDMTSKPEKTTLGSLSYQEAGSMSKYLVEQYGLDATLKHCKNVAELEELTGKSFLELYETWALWNEERYQELRILY